MSIRERNQKRRWRPCLKCGRSMHTDRCHRLCRRCRAENEHLGRCRRVSIPDEMARNRLDSDDPVERYVSIL